MNSLSMCPACRRDVRFEHGSQSSRCPECGATFARELPPGSPPPARARVGLLAVAWMFAPAVVALLLMAALPMKERPQFGQYFTDYPRLFTSLLGLSAVSCYAACSWFMGRFTDKWWARLLVGLFLGLAMLVCNVIIVFFGSCAYTGELRS